MTNKDKYIFLNFFNHNDNIEYLHKEGYSYTEIYRIIKILVLKEYLDNKYSVTSKAEVFIYFYEKKHKIKKYSKWIVHSGGVWKEPVSPYTIYFPNN